MTERRGVDSHVVYRFRSDSFAINLVKKTLRTQNSGDTHQSAILTGAGLAGMIVLLLAPIAMAAVSELVPFFGNDDRRLFAQLKIWQEEFQHLGKFYSTLDLLRPTSPLILLDNPQMTFKFGRIEF